MLYLKKLFSTLLTLAIMITLIDLYRASSMEKEALPKLNLKQVSGPLLEKKGSQIYYVFASWCTPCHITTPSMKKLNNSFDVTGIAISSGSDQDVRKYLKKNSIDFTVLNDPNNLVGQKWGTQVTPTILFVKDDKIVHSTTGISFYPGLWLRAFYHSL